MVLFLRQENNHYKVAKDFLGTIIWSSPDLLLLEVSLVVRSLKVVILILW